jgi:ribosomal protein S18 acetylase RimI-like enzyme
MLDPSVYAVRIAVPDVDTYRGLRVAAGLSAKSLEAAERGLSNTLFAVQILCEERPVGMGRVIGDGGCFYQVVDIAVLPAHQGKGLGKQIMTEIMRYLAEHVPASGYVSLIADGQAHALYEQFGFIATAPKSIAMALRTVPRVT